MGIINRRDLSGTGVSPAHVPAFLDLLDLSLDEVVNVGMDDAPNVTGGGTSVSVGFQLRNVKGDALAKRIRLDLAAYQSAGLAQPAASATLDGASAGTILLGSGTAAVSVETDENGKFTCRLTDPVDETIFLACAPVGGSPILDCREVDAVAFSA